MKNNQNPKKVKNHWSLHRICRIESSVAEPHNFYAAPGKNFDAAPAPAPTLLYSKPTFCKQTKINLSVEALKFV
jgi:hypothetical protein